jgi:Predicted Zn-dependent proteases
MSALLSCVVMCQGADTATTERIAELEKIIADGGGGSNLSTYHLIDQYWELADLQKKSGDHGKWYLTISRALRMEPFDYKRQIDAAEYEYNNGSTNLAIARLSGIAGDTSQRFSIQRGRAKSILNKIPKAAIDAAAKQPQVVFPVLKDGTRPAAYIMPFPGADSNITARVARRLAEEFHCVAQIMPMAEEESAKDSRDVRKRTIDAIAEQAQKDYDRADIMTFLAQRQMTINDLRTDAGKEKFVKALLLSNNEKDGSETWKHINSLRPQRYSDTLFDQALARIGGRNAVMTPSILGVFLITADDIFMSENNGFVFACASNFKRSSVISYARFAYDNPTAKKLAQRCETQAISTFAFSIGLDRCAVPRCANSQSYSVDQLDRKTQSLCEFCKQNVAAIYAKKINGK